MWLSLFVLVYVPGRALMLAAGAQRESGSPSFSVSLLHVPFPYCGRVEQSDLSRRKRLWRLSSLV